MTEPELPPVRRRGARRASVLTGAVVLLSLSLAPGAHADGGDGLLGGVTGGVTGAVGGVSDPVVEPVVEVVQSAVPQPVQQPVQQAVAPVVEEVVQPVMSGAQQAVAPVPGAHEATQPIVKAVESVVHPVVHPDGTPDGNPGGGGQDAPPTGPAPATAPSSVPAGTGPTPSTDVPGPAQGAPAQDAPASDGTTHAHGPSGFAPCDGLDALPPRGTASPAVGERVAAAAEGSSWDVVDALLARSSAPERSDASDAREPATRLTDVPWFDATGGGFGVAGRTMTVPLLSGLLALVGALLVGAALVRSRQHA